MTCKTMNFKDSSAGVREVDADIAHGWQGLLCQVPARIQPGKLSDESQQG